MPGLPMSDREEVEILLAALAEAGAPTRMVRLSERGHALLLQCVAEFERRSGKRCTHSRTCEVALEILLERLRGLPDE